MFYKIILKPIDNFYFGGENSFGKSSQNMNCSQKYFAKRSAYFAKGEMFPQQTQLLGMIRKSILRKHGCLKLHNNGEWVDYTKCSKKKADDLVGSAWQGEKLGKILQLTPLYLHQKKNEDSKEYIFYPAPYDDELTLDKQKGISYINGREDSNYVYAFKRGDKHFGAKDYLCSAYISGTQPSVELDKVFTKDTRIGNQTFGNSEEDEERLYKMTSYVFSKEYKDFSFVCYLESSDNTLFGEAYKQIVELGGERSLFDMSVVEVDSIPDSANSYAPKEQDRIVLLSDAYIDVDTDSKENIFSHVDVALAKKVSFRSLAETKDGFSKSNKQTLLTKGSVFYPENDKSTRVIETILEKQTAYRKIGYNQFITIDKKEG